MLVLNVRKEISIILRLDSILKFQSKLFNASFGWKWFEGQELWLKLYINAPSVINQHYIDINMNMNINIHKQNDIYINIINITNEKSTHLKRKEKTKLWIFSRLSRSIYIFLFFLSRKSRVLCICKVSFWCFSWIFFSFFSFFFRRRIFWYCFLTSLYIVLLSFSRKFFLRTYFFTRDLHRILCEYYVSTGTCIYSYLVSRFISCCKTEGHCV